MTARTELASAHACHGPDSDGQQGLTACTQLASAHACDGPAGEGQQGMTMEAPS
ncbi:hypothetical protein [Actinoplanes sp. NPDC049599]|uniref:hypothetical protein n=1 Tax=Actinoplanes sp. NPDC049599 TaxID=3363903 RepID=UPI0037AC2331